MFPGNFNPGQMKKMMAQMGIKSEDLKASKVVIYCEDKTIVIESPSVTAIEMQGQKSFQIAGNVKEEAKAEDKQDDVLLVMQQAGVTREVAEKALKESNGDIAEAIMKLGE